VTKHEKNIYRTKRNRTQIINYKHMIKRVMVWFMGF